MVRRRVLTLSVHSFLQKCGDPAQTPIGNNKKTPTSDNVGTPAAPLHPKPACNCMCPLEQRASGTSAIEWTTDVADDSAASKPPPKKKTPHSDPTTAPAQTTIDNDNNTTPTSDSVSALAAASSPARTFGILRVPKPPTKQKTPHSDTKTAPVLTTIDDDVTLRRCAPRRPEGARRPPPWHRFPGG